jgi:hypothetical protein
MPKGVPPTLTEDQIKFWLSNSGLTKEQLKEWYAAFVANSNKNQQMDKEQFVKYFAQLEAKKGNAEDFAKLAFKGN